MRLSKQESEAESFLGGDSQDVPIDGDLNAGSRIFMRSCAQCHTLNANSKGKKSAGPALGIVYGKRAGQDHYYSHYSYPMVGADFFWNKQSLFSFLKSPQKFLPVLDLLSSRAPAATSTTPKASWAPTTGPTSSSSSSSTPRNSR